MKKIKPGDVFRLTTENTVAYIHFIDVMKTDQIEYNRVIYCDKDEQRSLEEIILNSSSYGLIFPVGAAYRKKIIDLVGNIPINNYKIPRFFSSVMKLHENDKPIFYIVDAVTELRKKIDVPDKEFRKLDPYMIPGVELLKHRVNKRWTPADGIENI